MCLADRVLGALLVQNPGLSSGISEFDPRRVHTLMLAYFWGSSILNFDKPGLRVRPQILGKTPATAGFLLVFFNFHFQIKFIPTLPLYPAARRRVQSPFLLPPVSF